MVSSDFRLQSISGIRPLCTHQTCTRAYSYLQPIWDISSDTRPLCKHLTSNSTSSKFHGRKSTHDRFANIELTVLLQSFNMATNPLFFHHVSDHFIPVAPIPTWPPVCYPSISISFHPLDTRIKIHPLFFVVNFYFIYWPPPPPSAPMGVLHVKIDLCSSLKILVHESEPNRCYQY